MTPRVLELPALSLVLLVGASRSARSTFAERCFRPTEVVSSERLRGWVADDEAEPEGSTDADELLCRVVEARLRRGRLTVVDAPNLEPERRRALLDLARARHAPAVAIVFESDEPGEHASRAEVAAVRRSLGALRGEGVHLTYVLAPDEAPGARVSRVPDETDRRDLCGPFDLIGDVHGCRSELDALLGRLGWAEVDGRWRHPEGRTAVFLGDLVDRGPDSPGVLRRVMAMVRDGAALCVPGNHDARLVKALRGRTTSGSHGLALTLRQLASEPDAFKVEVADFLDGLASHLVLDGGRLVVAHAGCTEELQGRSSAAVRAFCLYGDTTGELDGYGLPVRADWAGAYRGRAKVVHGHVPVARAAWVNGVLDVDTGCVFGGRLTALRWPEEELVDVPAERVWFAPVKPLEPGAEEPRPPDRLDLREVTGDRRLETRLRGAIALTADGSAGALELASRFAVDPRWLLYVPPTMSPCDAAPAGAPLLEHPAQAFAHYRDRGVGRVVVEEKHPGSRACLLVCRTPEVAVSRFGAAAPRRGVITSRTGRPLLPSRATEEELLRTLAEALDDAGRWEAWGTDWALLDAVLLPGSAAAGPHLPEPYAATAAVAVHTTGKALVWLRAAVAGDPSLAALLARTEARADAARGFDAAWRRRAGAGALAPFAVLATEGAVHLERDRGWHLSELGRLRHPSIRATAHRVVDLSDARSAQGGVDLWTERVADGGEGVVVKPFDGVARDPNGDLVQPALKVRGREPLRLWYGAEYTLPENLERLRSRGLQKKRSLALRQFALGHEALCRFVEGRPLHEVHACVSAVLALASEPVDPRL
jgi:protein phosphatase